MAINAPQDFATAMLTDMGAPVTANHINTLTNWLAAENPWPPPRNNPLNNGLGSGGGSGLGSYPSLEVAAQYAAQNLSAGDYGYPAAKAVLMSNGSDAQFRSAIIASSWAGGHYAGTDYAKGVPVGSASSDTSTATTTQGQGTGGTNSTPPESLSINGVTYSGQGTPDQVSATEQVNSTFQAYGFSGQDLQQLTQFSWNEITSGTPVSQVALDVQNLPAFENRFPGLKERTAAGYDAMQVSDYLAYETAATQQARALGLPDGFMTKQEIGTLIANNVSPTELSDRLNNVYVVANNANQAVKDQLKAYFGYDITPGGLAALALDPKKAEPLLQQQVTAAQLGGAGVQAGLGAVTEPVAMQIAQTGITQAGIQSGIGQIAPLAPLEKALPGGSAAHAQQQVVSVDQLAKGQFLASQPDQRALQIAQESRAQPFKGGGGYVNGPTGNVGTGSAGSQGGQGTKQ